MTEWSIGDVLLARAGFGGFTHLVVRDQTEDVVCVEGWGGKFWVKKEQLRSWIKDSEAGVSS